MSETALNLDFDLGLGDPPDAAPQKVPEKKAVIVIDQEQDKPNYEFVGVNGVGYQIKRGEEVTVPLSVVEVLNNAIATRTVQTTNPTTGQTETTYQDYHAIPFRVVRYL